MMMLLSATEMGVETANLWTTGSGNTYVDVLIITGIVVMLVLLFFAFVTQRAIHLILQLTMPEASRLEAEKSRLSKIARQAQWKQRWNDILGVRPIEEEKDIVIEHDYDGIRELDNPIPIWFNALFYATVIFGIVYLLVYHVFGWGMNQDQEYIHEVAKAEKAKQEYLAQAANLIDESSVEFNETMAQAGKAVFMANCIACHGSNGEGGIGPNLTDRFWLHGGEIKDVFKTVKYGVPEKGMVPWEQTLTPGQIAEVSSYILTLRDTKPANAKAPEGTEVKAYASEGETEPSADRVEE